MFASHAVVGGPHGFFLDPGQPMEGEPGFVNDCSCTRAGWLALRSCAAVGRQTQGADRQSVPSRLPDRLGSTRVRRPNRACTAFPGNECRQVF
jgi:hypothetical protein